MDYNAEINPYILMYTVLTKENCPPPGHIYDQRIVKWFELEYITSGGGYCIENGRKIDMQKGRIFFRKPGMYVQCVQPYQCHFVVFDLIYDKTLMEQYNEEQKVRWTYHPFWKGTSGGRKSIDALTWLPDYIDVVNVSKFQNLFEGMYNEYILNGLDNQFILKSYIYQILAELWRENDSSNKALAGARRVLKNREKINKVTEYIETNRYKFFRLEELSEAAGVSPNFLCRIFKEATGTTLFQYINEKKINYAKHLLTSTSQSVKEIAINCGFENEPYFFTTFKKHVGRSPLQYRLAHSYPSSSG